MSYVFDWNPWGPWTSGTTYTATFPKYKSFNKGDLVRLTRDVDLPENAIEMVKKARRQRQQFKVGQVITSDTLREVMWLRGTVIEAVKNGAAFVLREDGKWHDILGGGCECAAGWPFEDFAGDYKLVRLP